MKRNEGVTGAASLTEAAISTPTSIKTKPIVFVQRRTLPVLPTVTRRRRRRCVPGGQGVEWIYFRLK